MNDSGHSPLLFQEQSGIDLMKTLFTLLVLCAMLIALTMWLTEEESSPVTTVTTSEALEFTSGSPQNASVPSPTESKFPPRVRGINQPKPISATRQNATDRQYSIVEPPFSPVRSRDFSQRRALAATRDTARMKKSLEGRVMKERPALQSQLHRHKTIIDWSRVNGSRDE